MCAGRESRQEESVKPLCSLVQPLMFLIERSEIRNIAHGVYPGAEVVLSHNTVENLLRK